MYIRGGEVRLFPRRIVSYFEYEQRGGQRRAWNFEKDLEEIVDFGFNTIVFCISEETLRNATLLKKIGLAIAMAKKKGLICWADPWGLGKFFGGEGISFFAKGGGVPCLCNPQFDQLLTEWVFTVRGLGVDGIFWDEPERKKDKQCLHHSELVVVAKYSKLAKELGLFNSVCIPAEAKRLGLIRKLVKVGSIDDIATDPYWPNAFNRIGENERVAYIEWWAQRIKSIADRYGKSCHLWLQGFGIREGDVAMTRVFSEAMARNGVLDWAFWGFRGCESLFGGKDFPGCESPEIVWRNIRGIFGRDNKTIWGKHEGSKVMIRVKNN